MVNNEYLNFDGIELLFKLQINLLRKKFFEYFLYEKVILEIKYGIASRCDKYFRDRVIKKKFFYKIRSLI